MKKLAIIISSLFLVFVLSYSVKAIEKAKEQTITINTNDNSLYYLDIVFEEQDKTGEFTPNIANTSTLDQAKIAKILAFEDSSNPNLKSSYLKGSYHKLEGSLVPVSGKHAFIYHASDQSYFEAEQNKIKAFKIVVVKEDLSVQVSDLIVVETYHTALDYNLDTNEVSIKTNKLESLLFALVASFVSIILQLVLFFLMKFSFKEHSVRFGFISGTITIAVSIALTYAIQMDSRSFAYQTLFIFSGVGMLLQVIIYPIAIKMKKSVLYAILASIINLLVLLIMMQFI